VGNLSTPFGLSLSKPVQAGAAVESACKPGLAPAGDLLFFASPKKSTQKKGDPMVWEFFGVRLLAFGSPCGCGAMDSGLRRNDSWCVRFPRTRRDRHVCTREQHTRPNEVPLHRPAGRGRGWGWEWGVRPTVNNRPEAQRDACKSVEARLIKPECLTTQPKFLANPQS